MKGGQNTYGKANIATRKKVKLKDQNWPIMLEKERAAREQLNRHRSRPRFTFLADLASCNSAGRHASYRTCKGKDLASLEADGRILPPRSFLSFSSSEVDLRSLL